MDLGISGRVALVAAASRGLGRAVAEELAAEGVNLLICSRDANAIRAAADEIAATHGVRALGVKADVSDPADIRKLHDHIVDGFGRVDILVTNAGGPPGGLFEAHDLQAWQATFELTLGSVLSLVYEVLPGMKERRWGRIINISSIAAKQPVDNLILSNTMRPAVTGLARTLANEVATYGITVNTLLPGYTRTERVEQLAETASQSSGKSVEEIRGQWEAQIPMKRLAEPREFGAAAAFLASDRASYITGQAIAVDGGWIRALM